MLRFSREVAFSAARVYARAAETRGNWDARLQALLVDALLRGDRAGRTRQPGRRSRLGRTRPPSRWRSAAPPRRQSLGHPAHACIGWPDGWGADVLGGVHGSRTACSSCPAPSDPLAATEKILAAFGDGPVVVGPMVPSLEEAAHDRPGRRWPVTARPRAWPAAPRPVAAADLLPRARAGRRRRSPPDPATGDLRRARPGRRRTPGDLATASSPPATSWRVLPDLCTYIRIRCVTAFGVWARSPDCRHSHRAMRTPCGSRSRSVVWTRASTPPHQPEQGNTLHSGNLRQQSDRSFANSCVGTPQHSSEGFVGASAEVTTRYEPQ